MRPQHVPRINLRYWLGITLASVFGTNMGDLYAHDSGLAILPGLGVLGVLCAMVFIVEHFDTGARELYYWLVIIIIRSGATNIADYSAYRMRIPALALNAGLIIMLIVLAVLQRRTTTPEASPAARLPATGVIYWIAMLTAGVLGTVLGDVCEHSAGDGPAAVALAAVLAVVLWWRRRSVGPFYWLIVAVARTAGTAIGDWLAEDRTLNIGLPFSTLITGLLFVGLLYLWRPRGMTVTASDSL
jgi:MYXO-CTERM domain-containing protein